MARLKIPGSTKNWNSYTSVASRFALPSVLALRRRCNKLRQVAHNFSICSVLRQRTVTYAVWTGLKDHQRRQHVYSKDRPWHNYRRSTSFAQQTACWPPHVMQRNRLFDKKNRLKNMRFLVYMYYTHSGYQTSIFGKNCAYYIPIFTV